MRFSRLLPSGAFADESRLFAVRGILSTNDLARERALMPDFPGLSDVETCREWDLGLPMNDADLRDPDNEAYWKQFRATPKAVVTLAAGRAMWSNRFGDLTSVRYAGSAENVAAVAERLRAALDPADLGLFFVPVREWAARAASQGMDFGPLFLGMSAFLIAASLLLAAMLFVFGVQQRSAEIGLLRAVGYRPEHVRALLLIEGGAAACAGTLVGVPLGELLARVLVLGLGTFWKGAVAGSPISYHARVGTVLVGECAGVLCAMLAIAVATWSRACRAPRELLLSDIESEPETTRRGRPVLRPWVAATAASAAGGLIAWTMAAKPRDVAAVFFGAGALLLVAGLAAASALLARLARTPRRLTLGGLAFRNAARRPGRSLATAGLLACGGFMVLAVSSMREDVGKHVAERGSGTGGFALFAESTIPVPDPLNSSKARKAFGLDAEPALAGATILSLRVRDGDDASCLNLNRAQAPRLIGVNAGELARLGAFAPTGQSERVWAALRPTGGGAEMPGLAGDLNTAMWGLKKRVGAEKGDVLNYRDESGEPFGVKLAGVLPMRVSVFQGAVLVPMEALAARFPSEAGYRVFLVDLPPGANTERARRALARRLERVGLDIVPCRERLEAFYTVEATYLTMFLALGGLGLALGSAGVGIVVLRNVLERRSELAVLRCIGFRRKDVQQLVAAEHRLLLVIGMAVGGMAALAAMWPNLRAPGTNLRVGAVAAIIAGLLAIGAAWIGLVARVAVRGRPAAALADT
jgi:ABC-type lipoprotein release transport system permease subunit